MKMFSDCSGPCETCKIHFTGGCLAGHGDDDYVHADPEWVADFTAGYRHALTQYQGDGPLGLEAGYDSSAPQGFARGYRHAMVQYKYRRLSRAGRTNPFSTSNGVSAELGRIRRGAGTQ